MEKNTEEIQSSIYKFNERIDEIDFEMGKIKQKIEKYVEAKQKISNAMDCVSYFYRRKIGRLDSIDDNYGRCNGSLGKNYRSIFNSRKEKIVCDRYSNIYDCIESNIKYADDKIADLEVEKKIINHKIMVLQEDIDNLENKM